MLLSLCFVLIVCLFLCASIEECFYLFVFLCVSIEECFWIVVLFLCVSIKECFCFILSCFFLFFVLSPYCRC